MAKKPTRPRDANQLAKSIVDQATGETKIPKTDEEALIKAAAAALGRKGGLKGGPARKKALSAARRKEIAQKAAAARWGNKSEE